MPATCFTGLPRSAAVIVQRWPLSLQGLSERWSRYPASQPFAAACALLGGLNGSHSHAHGCWRRRFAQLRRARASLLVSYTTLACVLTARPQKSAPAGRRQAKSTKVKHCDVKNPIHDRSASMAPVRMSAGSETS